MMITEHHIPVLMGTALNLKIGSKILGLLVHNNGRIHLLILENEQETTYEKRQFAVYGTEWPLDEELTYIGSISFGGSWHVFEDHSPCGEQSS